MQPSSLAPDRPTQALAEFAAGIRFTDLPAAVVTAVKVAILDGLANLAAGTVQDGAARVRRYLTAQGGTAESTLAGSDRGPAAAAALCNGVAMHSLDYEVQGYPSAHGTSSILPAVLAVAERDGLTGAQVLTAFAVGWDIQQRVRIAGLIGDMRSFHPPGVVGPLGAAAAVANLLSLDPAGMRRALGLAASRSGGVFANNGTMAKSLHPGGAARSGVESADLAALGITSNEGVLEAYRGFDAALFGRAGDWARALDGLGERFEIVEPGFFIKRYPAEIFMQWPAHAAVTLQAREQLSAGAIERVEVNPPLFRQDLSRPQPASGLDGKFSYEYCVAVALATGRLEIGSFADRIRVLPEVEDLLGKVQVVEDPHIPSDKLETWARVVVQLRGGRRLTETCRSFPGAIGKPLAAQDHRLKVADCLTCGGMAEQIDPLITLVKDLDHANSVDPVMALFRMV